MHGNIPEWLWHASPGERFMMMVAAAGAFALFVGFTSAWVGAYFGARRAARKAVLAASAASSQAMEARIAQLTQAVDAIALEVERMSEGQRFVARVLVERGNGALGGVSSPIAPPRGPGSVTPH